MSENKIRKPKGYEKESQNKTFEVDVCDCITLEEYGIKNIRTEYPESKGKELKESIRKDGIKEAGEGFRHPEKEGKIVMFKGHHRVIFGREIEAEENRPIRMRVKIRDTIKWTEADFIYEMYIENSLRADMSTYENALAVKRLVDSGMDFDGVARKLSKMRADGYPDLGYVRNCLILCEAPESILKLVISGDLASSEVVRLKKKNDDWAKVEEIIFKAQEKRDEILGQKTAPSKARTKKIMTRHIEAAASESPQAVNLVNSGKELKRAFKKFEKANLTGKDIKDPIKRAVYDWLHYINTNQKTQSDIDSYLFSE